MISDNKMRWDKRRSGRTRGMLAAAMRQCFAGRHVYIVVHDLGSMFNYCVPILQDMGATRIRNQDKIVEFGHGCELIFIGLDNNKVGPMFAIEGVHDENVFWDHEAVRRKFNHVIRRFHEYD